MICFTFRTTGSHFLGLRLTAISVRVIDMFFKTTNIHHCLDHAAACRVQYQKQYGAENSQRIKDKKYL